MSTFEVENKYDGIYCTVDTFRHLLTEKKAIQHLENVSFALKKNGIYILGLHIIPRHKKIEKIVKTKQYERMSYEIEFFPKENEIPITKNEIIAFGIIISLIPKLLPMMPSLNFFSNWNSVCFWFLIGWLFSYFPKEKLQ